MDGARVAILDLDGKVAADAAASLGENQAGEDHIGTDLHVFAQNHPERFYQMGMPGAVTPSTRC